jgi:cellulose synthase/poly-beta-1,6-N-acetylglucosamine synthase-like glycosyltransferase
MFCQDRLGTKKRTTQKRDRSRFTMHMYVYMHVYMHVYMYIMYVQIVALLTAVSWVRKTIIFEPFISKNAIILPRQARDKHG